MDNSIFEKAKESFFWVLSSSILFQVVNWTMTILVVRILTPEDYGMFGLLMIINAYFGPLTHWNISSWYVWKDKVTEVEERTVEITILIFSFLVFVLVFLSSQYIANFFKQPELVFGFKIISVLFFLGGFNKISLMKFERDIDFKPTSILNVCLRLSQGLMTLSFALFGFGYKSLVFSMLITAIFRSIVLFKLRPPVVLKDMRLFDFKIDTFKESWSYGAHITLGMFLWVIYSNADNLVIGKNFGPEILGYYSLAFFFIDMPLSKLNEWIRPILHPYFSRLKDNMDSLNRVFLRLVFIYMTILMPILLGIIVVAEEFVHFVLGPEWKGAVSFLQLLAIVGLLRAVADLVGPYLVALGYPQYGKYANAIATATMPLSFYFGSLLFGIKGIYFTWFIIYPVVPIFMLYFFVKKSDVSLYRYFSNFLPAVVSCLIMLLFVYIVKCYLIIGESLVYTFIGEIIVGCLVYILSMFLFFKHQILEAKRVFQH